VTFYEPKLEGLRPGSRAYFEVQRKLINERPLVRACYEAWYTNFLEDEATVPQEKKGALLEIGCGASFLGEMVDGLVMSDISEGLADCVMRAEMIPFRDESVRAIFVAHGLHHFFDVQSFFEEVARVLVPGGVLCLVEPAHTLLARFFFSEVCVDEGYDDQTKTWNPGDVGWRDANQALSWVVFFRDYEDFRRKFPELRLEKSKSLPWFGYSLSGGVTRKNPIPTSLVPLVCPIEFMLKLVAPLTSLHWFLTVKKTE